MFSCLKFKVFLISSLVGDSFRSFCTSSVLGKYVVFWQSGIASLIFQIRLAQWYSVWQFSEHWAEGCGEAE